MLTRDEIVVIISKDNELPRICRNIAKEKNRGDDLYQELMLAVLEYNHQRIEEIYNSSVSAFRFFVVRIAMNMAYNRSSTFNKKTFIYEGEEALEHQIESKQISKEPIINAVESQIKIIERDCIKENKYPYELEMFRSYIEEGSLRKLSAKTGIPLKSCGNAVKFIKDKIKSNVRLEDFAH